MISSSSSTNIHDQINEAESQFAIREPQVMAFVPEEDRFRRLRNEAELLIAGFPNTEERPELFGLLIGVKDIFHVDGFTTRAGSRLPVEILKGSEAESVTRLKKAGALVLGKTVTTEFAYFSPGPTRNPHNLEHTPGGSSSGSAAAIAAGLCRVTLGTQTIGSIIRPAAFCGVVGIKPSYDRISRNGVIPLAPSLDHVGFFTPDVATAKLVAPVIYKDWNKSVFQKTKPSLGIPEGPYLEKASEPARNAFQRQCEALRNAGYEIWRVNIFADLQEITTRNEVILAGEAARGHAKWFDQYSDLYSSRTAELIRRGQKITDEQLAQALNEKKTFQAQLDGTMKSNEIDLWISPATIGTAPKGLESTGDPAMNLPWTQAGLPTINIPAGKDGEGMPIGLQVTGGPSQDEKLLGWAEELEMIVSKL
jgi:Asp-tRNA(Asn)/Glu-tRNA(Gln) amidotransferase A subunit family amidase